MSIDPTKAFIYRPSTHTQPVGMKTFPYFVAKRREAWKVTNMLTDRFTVTP
jgi:hypothetical protein